jgi:SpoVK/Ycf46/Vps4 family AAA+-type ATPase
MFQSNSSDFKRDEYHLLEIGNNIQRYEVIPFFNDSIFTNLNKDLFIQIFKNSNNKTFSVYLIFLLNNIEHNKFIEKFISNYRICEDIKKPKFYQISHQNNNFSLQDYEVHAPEIKKYYYNDLDINKIVDIINNDKCGILLFSGIPGSGKTTLIKYLLSIINKKFYNLSIQNIEGFNDPSLQSFILNNLKNSVIILEDCENLIKSRKINTNNISTLLNLGDGLLGEALNLKIILTYNVADNIDNALLRKGRTLFKHNFKALTIENANKLAIELNINKIYDSEVSLADVFYEKDENYVENKNNIGFK